MTRANPRGPRLELDPETEKTQKQLKRRIRYLMNVNRNNGQQQAEGQELPARADGAIAPPAPQMNQQLHARTVRDYLEEDLEGLNPAVTMPNFEAEHFELKPVLFNMLNTLGQFGGTPNENARQHVKSFLEICNSFKIHGVSNDVLKDYAQLDIRPPPPFPQRMKKQKQDYQFKKFFDILKQVHINMPLVEALQQMPNYAKFLKDMVTRKRRIEEFETAAATETCLALMHNKVPAKKTDPGSIAIECFIGHNYPIKALCDPGANIYLMPKYVFRKLGIGEEKPTTIEDILVQVDKFIFPADFLILDCEADEHASIILGRPFLSTIRAIIDFEKDEIIFKVDDDKVKMKSLTK
ncbi:hypothetical protein GQ457_10G014550 [Hibiscus cannabinus]